MESLQIAFQLLFVTLCLFLLGEPWRMALRRFSGLFQGLDFLQILVLDVYLGGFVLYAIAIAPLQLFSSVTLYALTLISFVVVFLAYLGQLRPVLRNLFSYREKFSFRNRLFSESTLVVLIFFFSLAVQILSLNGILFGSVRDTAIHSLFTQVLIENRQIPLTMEPYLSEGIIYPQGFTPIIAYVVFVLGFLPPQAVLYVTILFNALTVLGVYFLGKTLSSSGKVKMGLSLAFVFAFVAAWPTYITWGSNPFVASFPLFFVCLSFFPLLVKSRLQLRKILVVGLLFGFLAVLHLQTYEMLVTSLFVWWVYIAIRRRKDKWIRLGYFVSISALSLVVLSPFIMRQFAFYSYLYHNVGVPSDIVISSVQPSFSLVLTNISWLFENFSVNPFLSMVSFALVFLSVWIIVVFRRKNVVGKTDGLVRLGLATFLGELFVFLLAAVVPNFFFYPQPLLLYFPLYFFVSALVYLLYNLFSSQLSNRIFAEISESDLRKKILVMGLSCTLVLAFYSPFLYQSLVFDVGALHGSYNVFGVTTNQDLQLIFWIRDNLPLNSTILVNTFQAGTFIPSIANRKVVFPSFGSSYSASYQELVTMLEGNRLDTTVYSLLNRFNITDVYVGSGVSPWDGSGHRWNPMVFLGNPNFRLLKNFGNAYLFQYDYRNSNIVFLDDFEHEYWYDYGWQTYFDGNGVSNIYISSDLQNPSERYLTMTAQAVYTMSTWKYARSVFREIFVQNDSDVTLSVYLDAREGFHGNDTFAIFISNIYHNQTLVVETPNGVYKGYAHSISLDGFETRFNITLSTVWRQMLNSPLPNDFILELVNYDLDGVVNVARVGDIIITSTPRL